MAYLDDTGIHPPRLADLLAQLKASLATNIGPGVNTSADGVFGQLIAIAADLGASCWEAIQALYDSDVPANATGVHLDNLAMVIGLTRIAATRSTVTLEFSGTPGTVIPAGRTFATPGGVEFTLDEAVTIGGGGTGEGVASAVQTGPLDVDAGTITEIRTAQTGLDSVTNPDTVTSGRAVESDEELLARMQSSGQIVGSTTLGAIKARLAEVAGVLFVEVFENDTDAPDGDGRPPHSIEALLWPNTLDEETIGRLLWSNKAAGVQTHGTTTISFDQDGATRSASFSFAAAVPCAPAITITVDPAKWIAGSEDAVTAAMVALSGEFGVGGDVLVYRLVCAVADLRLPGVLDVTATVQRTGGPPNVGNLSIDYDEIATFEGGDVTVTVV